MGSVAAETLTRAGFSVTVWNRTEHRAVRVVERTGASLTGSPAQAADADVAITMVADRAAVDEVFAGPGGLLEGAHPGLVVCEMSTVEPEVSQQLAPRLRESGADLLDTPVSGSVPAVEQGTLVIMAGGRADALGRARPVLDALATRIFHLGPVGSGAAMKLAVNAIVHGLNQALSEALVLAEAAGISRSLAYDVFESSAAGAPFLRYKRQAFERPEQAPVAFRLALARKDLELIVALADQLGMAMDQTRANLEVLEAAAGQFSERDMSALAEYLRELSGTSAADGR